jgi:hypothetical protein
VGVLHLSTQVVLKVQHNYVVMRLIRQRQQQQLLCTGTAATATSSPCLTAQMWKGPTVPSRPLLSKHCSSSWSHSSATQQLHLQEGLGSWGRLQAAAAAMLARWCRCGSCGAAPCPLTCSPAQLTNSTQHSSRRTAMGQLLLLLQAGGAATALNHLTHPSSGKSQSRRSWCPICV